MEDIVDLLCNCSFDDNGDGTAVYETDQERYGCVEEKDIKSIAEDIVKATPLVEFHISAIMSDEFEDGEQCIEIDYANGQMDIKISEDAYEEWDDEDDEE